MLTEQTAVTIHKASYGAMGAGSATSIYFGMTLDAWSVFGIIAGILVGVCGLIANIALTWHFKSEHLRLARERAHLIDAAMLDDEEDNA